MAAAGTFAVLVTAAVLLAPDLPFALRSPALHAAVESLFGCIALAAGVLAYGRYRRSGLLPDAALTVAFLLSGTTNLAFAVVPVVAEGWPWPALQTWGVLAARVCAAATFAAAAVLPQHLRISRRRWLLSAVVVAVLATIAGVVATLGDRLPVEAGPAPGTASRAGPFAVTAHPLLTSAHALTLSLYTLAAAGFWRRWRRRGDAMTCWLAAAAVLGVAARLHFLLHPSLYTSVVYSGDVLRLGFYLLLLGAAAVEFTSYWRGQARLAVLEERRRVARNLHDGLAQELSFIASQAHWLQEEAGHDPRVGHLATAAQRALAEARQALSALNGAEDEPLALAMQREVEVGERLGIRVRLDLADDLRVTPQEQEMLVRVMREAVGNAARHSGAPTVWVSLIGGEQPVLEVVDDGKGFDVDEAGRKPGSYGLTSIRERAEALGATCMICSSPGDGTIVRVTLR